MARTTAGYFRTVPVTLLQPVTHNFLLQGDASVSEYHRAVKTKQRKPKQTKEVWVSAHNGEGKK